MSSSENYLIIIIDDNGDYEKFKRRCERLLNLIENNEKIVFVYYNCYTNYFNDIIDFYNTFLIIKIFILLVYLKIIMIEKYYMKI